MRRLEQEFGELERQLADPEVIADPERLRVVGRRHARLKEIIDLYREYGQALADAADAEAMLSDATDEEMAEFLRSELEKARSRAEELHGRLLLELVPGDPMEDRNAIVEIRAGTGGEEAALFARDLFNMYVGLAQRRGWKVNVLDENPTELGGIKEVVFQVEGPGVYGVLRLESGVHRVQRVPITESQGRIHTSAATVAVFPEVEDVEVDVNPSDLRIEAFRAGGPGGQHMQKNETAVRVTHLPTGISVTCSDARSQHQNREKAIRILRSRLYELAREEQEQRLAQQRREQVRSGDRSEKIRTYNFPQDRITDHRIGLSIHSLPSRLAGEIDELLEALARWDRQRRLQEALAAEE
ncbi:MAG: peptide chain release factor 1 [Armatimonadetes bacterium]|nr:peptide chain release factor 1 [Armatimonadota bacterium]